MKIIICSDHTGFAMKQELSVFLEAMGHEIEDIGTFSEESAEYPIYGRRAGKKLAAGEADYAVLLCGTGFGISLAANKIRGVRCVNCSEPYTAHMSRLHNNANAVSIGARVVGVEMAKMILKMFLETEFEGGRHARRVEMIEDETI